MSELKPLKLYVPLKDWMRFLKFVRTCVDKNGCWVWAGYCDKKGYGQFWYDGRMWWAHRFAWLAKFGDIPQDETIEHECCNPSCVNPDHARPLDRETNSARGHLTRGKNMVQLDSGEWVEEPPF